MSEFPLFRTLAIPLGIAIVFLVFAPRLCQRAVITVNQRQPITASLSQPAPHGLVIQSSTPTRGELHLPPGLDADRIQYLIEIDSTFATPFVMTTTESSPITKVLLERQYAEQRPNGTFAPTREGLLNVSGAVDSPGGWIVPVAQRKFAGIDAVDDAGDGRYNAVVRWRWEPNSLGASLLPKVEDHRLTVEFAGGEHHWVLSRFVKEPDREFR